MPEGRGISVTVLYSPAAREVHEWRVTLPAGACVLHALRASGISRYLALDELATVPLGIWGRRVKLETPLGQCDRIEIYRPLQVDPKLARRERFRKQGVRAAGLFAARKVEGEDQP
jgi:putative ubiquitin-RnfH superfamily antitoxin RatB of RatAB toxin-antitoxin module